MHNPEDIVEFCNVTGASAQDAESFLEMTNGDLETAVSLYMESTSSSSFSSKPSSSPAGASRSRPRESDYSYEYMDDEELARKIMREDVLSNDGVRAPIPAKTEVLIGGGGGGDYRHPRVLSARGGHVSSTPRAPNIFNQGDSFTSSFHDPFRNFDEESTSLAQGSHPAHGDKPRNLSELFKPPFDIMYKGTFENARKKARTEKKWLMVNIQDPTNFPCHELNRDLWKDTKVKEVIRESFIFIQYTTQSPEGEKYISFYPIKRYPHIAIIDPTTGESMRVWDTKVSAQEFLKNVNEFLGRDQKPKQNTSIPKKKPSYQASKDISEMTEEEQLNAAIAASLAAGGEENSTEIDLTKDDDVMLIEDDNYVDTPLKEEEPQGIENIKPVKREEPPAGPGVTKIQLRLPDGKRIVRRFNKEDLVKYLFEFVRAEVEGAREQNFELVFNRQQLINQINKTIKEAEIENALVSLAWS